VAALIQDFYQPTVLCDGRATPKVIAMRAQRRHADSGRSSNTSQLVLSPVAGHKLLPRLWEIESNPSVGLIFFYSRATTYVRSDGKSRLAEERIERTSLAVFRP